VIDENKSGRKNFLAMREAARNQRLEVVGRGLREMMTFLKKKKEAGVPEDDAAGAASNEDQHAGHDPARRHSRRGRLVHGRTNKLAIALKLDELGIDYIGGRLAGSNPRDKDFFARAKLLPLKHARLTAFGSTRFAKNRVDQDPNVRALVEAGDACH